MLRRLQTSLTGKWELCVFLQSWSGGDHMYPDLLPHGQSPLRTIPAVLAQPGKWNQESPRQLGGIPCSSLHLSSTNTGSEWGNSHLGGIKVGPAPTLGTVPSPFNSHNTTLGTESLVLQMWKHDSESHNNLSGITQNYKKQDWSPNPVFFPFDFAQHPASKLEEA